MRYTARDLRDYSGLFLLRTTNSRSARVAVLGSLPGLVHTQVLKPVHSCFPGHPIILIPVDVIRDRLVINFSAWAFSSRSCRLATATKHENNPSPLGEELRSGG